MSCLASNIQIFRAGAGSGKTYQIQETLFRCIKNGDARPDRVVAVTFTEAAAAELRERITQRLLKGRQIEHVLRLPLAYISTIHGFGRRILTEFAFDARLRTLDPELINEDEEKALIQLAMMGSDKLGSFAENLARYGYAGKYQGKKWKGSEEYLRDDVQEILSLLRFTDHASSGLRLRAIVNHACDSLRKVYGDQGASGLELEGDLYQCVEQLLNAYPGNMVGAYEAGVLKKSAWPAFDRDHKNLLQALNRVELSRNWPLWRALQDLRTAKPIDERYKALANSVKEAAQALEQHPGPLLMHIKQIQDVLQAAAQAASRYQQLKQEASRVDFMDMLALADTHLRENPELLKRLAKRIDVMVVDEFQDTNPLMFSLLWQLHKAGVPMLAVGDTKQAIMGFQGADHRLFDELCGRFKSRNLEKNWRSQAPLLRFMNSIGQELFEDDYKDLLPGKNNDEAFVPTSPEPLEFLVCPKGFSGNDKRAMVVGRRLKKLLVDGFAILDRFTKDKRAIRGSDIAVLCPTNKMLRDYAKVLRTEYNLKVSMNGGWFESHAVEIMRHALQFLENRVDVHAALYLVTTELGNLTLPEALNVLIQHVGQPKQAVDSLCEANHKHSKRGFCVLCTLAGAQRPSLDARDAYTRVAAAIERLDLFQHVSNWHDAKQQRANLVRLLNLATEFSELNPVALGQLGFYGGTISTFLSWLDYKRQQNDEQPEPSVIEEDAIVLKTWYTAKGLEWPIVVVAGLKDDFSPKFPNIAVRYRNFDHLSNLRQEAVIRYIPTFAARGRQDRAKEDLFKEQEETAQRLLYVAMTRPRNKLILEWPDYGEHKKNYTSTLLRSADGVCTRIIKDRAFDGLSYDNLVQDGKALAAMADSLDEEDGDRRDMLPGTGFRALKKRDLPDKSPLETVKASQSKTKAGDHVEGKTDFEEGLHIKKLYGFKDEKTLGTFLHQCYMVLALQPDRTDDLEKLAKFQNAAPEMNDIGRAVDRFENWIQDEFQPDAVKREWQLLGLNDKKCVMTGIADVLIEVPGGVWLIDHKSDDFKPKNLIKQAQKHRGQIQDYCDMLEQNNKKVLGAGIHWIRHGAITWTHLAEGQTLPGPFATG